MLSFIIFIILLYGFIIGLKRGFILQAIHLIGYFVAFIVAYMYYDELAEKIILWIPYPNLGDLTAIEMFIGEGNLELAYYRSIAFLLIFVAVKVIMQIIGSMLDFVAHFPILRQINRWAGALLGFIEIYLILFILLYIGALLPIDSVQHAIGNSFLAKMIVEYTPILSSQIKDLWLS